MNAQARASNYVVLKPLQLKTYQKKERQILATINPPAHLAQMPPDACERLGRETIYTGLARSCGLPRAFRTVPGLTHHRLHLLSRSGERNVGFPRGIGIAYPDHTLFRMTLALTSSINLFNDVDILFIINLPIVLTSLQIGHCQCSRTRSNAEVHARVTSIAATRTLRFRGVGWQLLAFTACVSGVLTRTQFRRRTLSDIFRRSGLAGGGAGSHTRIDSRCWPGS
eukprot:1956450-Pleurochrysis_carterae.AAC.4